MKFNLRKCDRKHMVKVLRELDSLTLAPSNVQDIYDIDKIRNRVLVQHNTVKVFLDNNILTRILNLPVENKTSLRRLTTEERVICCLMGYFVYCGLLLIPNISMYESESTPLPSSRVDADIKFRYFDHLPAQVYLDLALMRINTIPLAKWSEAKKEVDNNSVTQADIASNDYTGNLSMQRIFALNLMKAWLIYQQTNEFEKGLETLMDWIYSNSLSDQNSLFFFIFLLSRKKLGPLLKNINSNDPDVIIKSADNAAWDLTHSHAFLTVSQKCYQDGIHIFCTRDKICRDLLRVSLKIVDGEAFAKYLSDNHTNRQSALINLIKDKHNNRPNRSEHEKSVAEKLESNIVLVESEIRDTLKT